MKSILLRFLRSNHLLKLNRSTHTLACSDLFETQKTHGRVLKLGISDVKSDIVISYYDSKAFTDACQLFDEVSDWDVVSATAIIGRFARLRRHKDAVYLFSSMLVGNIRPNEFTLGTLIHSSTARGDLNTGKQLHAFATKMGLHSNVFVGSAALDFYTKLSTMEEAQSAFEDTHEPNVVSYTTLVCGYLKKERFEDALRLFHEMPERNVVSWNAMIGGYSQTGHNEEAVNLFAKMWRQGLLPNQSTFPCAVSAAAIL